MTKHTPLFFILPKEELVQANAVRDAQEKRLAELTLVAILLSVVAMAC